jgi:Uma2 family endonuclease
MKLFLNFGKTSMTIAIDKLSFADYYFYTDGSDRRYELVDGELIRMSLGTGQQVAIAEKK